MEQNNILLESEKEEIKKSLESIFINETNKELQIDFKSFKAEINKIINEMDIQIRTYTIKWKNLPLEVIRYDMSKEVAKRNYLAMEGYLLIFKFREYLFNQQMNYRYYFQDKQTGEVSMRNFGDYDLLDFVSFADSIIKLNPVKIIEDKSKEGEEFFTQKMNQYINRYTSPDRNNFMKKTNSLQYNLRVVRSHIMRKYVGSNPGLLAKSGLYQTFNMGHIYESLDIALTDSVMNFNEEQRNSNLIDGLMFGRYLKRDSVIASRGGDNALTNTSIKSNQANLYSFNTISHQLVLIQQMLEMTSPEDVRRRLEYLFVDHSEKSNKVKDDLEVAAARATDKLWKEIQQLLKNKT